MFIIRYNLFDADFNITHFLICRCWSYVGNELSGHKQLVSLSRGCEQLSTAIHEVYCNILNLVNISFEGHLNEIFAQLSGVLVFENYDVRNFRKLF